MSSNRHNSFLSQSVFIFLIRFFPSLAATLVLIFFSRQLPADLYGDYQGVFVQFNIFNALACLGLHALFITYTPQILTQVFRRTSRRVKWLVALWMIVVSVVFAWLQSTGNLPLLTALFFCSVLSFTAIAESVLIVFRSFRPLAFINLLYSAGFCWLHYALVQRHWSLAQLFLYIALLAAGRLLCYALLILQQASAYRHQAADLLPARNTIRRLWLHMGIYDLVQILSRWVDKWVLALLLSKELFAIYFNATIEVPFLSLALSAASSAGLLQLARHADTTGKKDRSLELMLQSGRVLSAIVFPLFFFLLFFSSELFHVVLTHKYEGSIPIFIAGILVIPVRAYSFTTVLQHYHKGNIINTGAIAELVLACLLMYPLYLLLGLPGVALSFVISTYLQAAYYLYHSGRLLSLPAIRLIPLQHWLIKLIVFFFVFIALHYLLRLFFQDQFVLILGSASLVLTITVALIIDIKRSRAYGNQRTQTPVQTH